MRFWHKDCLLKYKKGITAHQRKREGLGDYNMTIITPQSDAKTSPQIFISKHEKSMRASMPAVHSRLSCKIAHGILILLVAFSFSISKLAVAGAQGEIPNKASEASSSGSYPKNVAASKQKIILYKANNMQIEQLVTPVFQSLPLDRKLYAYYLTRAIQVSDDIAWKQKTRDGFHIRQLMEFIWKNQRAFKNTVFGGERYAKYLKNQLAKYMFELYRNRGNYDISANQKVVLKGFSRQRFAQLVYEAAQVSNESVQTKNMFLNLGTKLEAAILYPEDKKYFAAIDAAEKISVSQSNTYGLGVTDEAFNGLSKEEQNGVLGEGALDFPYMGRDKQIHFLKHSIGGRFSAELKEVRRYYNLAAQYANAEEKALLMAYIKALQSGDPNDVREAEILWVQYKPKDIDFINNFTEVYMDPQGARGLWEGFIMIVKPDPGTAKRVGLIRENADQFEMRMPVKSEFKKPAGSTPPKAEGAYFLFGGGATGDTMFGGVNLPNSAEIREKFGSKSYMPLNAIPETSGAAQESEFLQKLENEKRMADGLPVLEPIAYFSPKYSQMKKMFDPKLLYLLQVEFHEILGHGSGLNLAGVKDTDLKELYNPLEEARAETASLYHITDPLIRDLDIVPKDWSGEKFNQFAEFSIVRFFTDQLRSFVRLKDDTTVIRQAHQLARQAMMNFMLSKGAIRILPAADSSAFPQVEVTDLKLAREVLGQFWDMLQTAKSKGAYYNARDIFENWGSYTAENKEWRRIIKTAVDKRNQNIKGVKINPSFKLLRDNHGEIRDVKIIYSEQSDSIDFFIDQKVALTNSPSSISSASSCVKLLE
jgi:dipeptidyl-peptidase-3